MAICRSKAELEQVMRKRISIALKNEITDLIREEIQHSIDDVVYGAGDPTVYKRRKDDGGLHDVRNMTSVLSADGCIVRVYDDASASGKNFDPLDEKIEYGYGNAQSWSNDDAWYARPRPFMTTAQEQINKQAKKVKNILQHAVDYGK